MSSAAASQADDVCEPQISTNDIPSTATKDASGPLPNGKGKSTAPTAESNWPHDIIREGDRTSRPSVSLETEEDGPPYEVHSGILQLARAMGSKGKPVHDAVSAALSNNRHYGKPPPTSSLMVLKSKSYFRACVMRSFTWCRCGDFACLGRPTKYSSHSPIVDSPFCRLDVGRSDNLSHRAFKRAPFKPSCISLLFCSSVCDISVLSTYSSLTN
jgi:hypothetical protein